MVTDFLPLNALLTLFAEEDQSGLKGSPRTLYQGGPSEKPQDGWGKAGPGS